MNRFSWVTQQSIYPCLWPVFGYIGLVPAVHVSGLTSFLACCHSVHDSCFHSHFLPSVGGHFPLDWFCSSHPSLASFQNVSRELEKKNMKESVFQNSGIFPCGNRCVLQRKAMDRLQGTWTWAQRLKQCFLCTKVLSKQLNFLFCSLVKFYSCWYSFFILAWEQNNRSSIDLDMSSCWAYKITYGRTDSMRPTPPSELLPKFWTYLWLPPGLCFFVIRLTDKREMPDSMIQIVAVNIGSSASFLPDMVVTETRAAEQTQCSCLTTGTFQSELSALQNYMRSDVACIWVDDFASTTVTPPHQCCGFCKTRLPYIFGFLQRSKEFLTLPTSLQGHSFRCV